MHAVVRSLVLAVTMGCAAGSGPTPPVEPDPATVAEPPPEPPAAGAARLRTVYVPAYSHLPRGPEERDAATMLSILLSVRNVDTAADVMLTHVDYYDTSGHRVRRYLSTPRVLRPLETAEFHVPTHDATGGSGANFLVYWEGPSDAHPVLTEAVMLGNLGAGYVAVTSRGIELDRRPDPAVLDRLGEDAEARDAPADDAAR